MLTTHQYQDKKKKKNGKIIEEEKLQRQ